MLKTRTLLNIKILIVAFLSTVIVSQSTAQCNFTDAPLGEICETAEYICGSKLNGYVGRLRVKNITEVFWNNSPNNPKAGVCNSAGQFDNTSWFSFTACSKEVHLRIHFNNCSQPQGNIGDTGIQTGLYSECRKTSSVACLDAVGAASGVVDLQYNNFVPGQLVYFVLDGYAASVCDFTIEVIAGLDTTPVIPPDPSTLEAGYITGPAQISCNQKFTPINFNLLEPERTVSFNNSCAPPPNFNPIDSVCYSWWVSPATGWNFYNNVSTGKSAQIVFNEPGTYTIYAQTNFNPFYVGSCANAASGNINSWTVTVLPENILTPAPEYICPGESRVFCGQQITHDTLIICDEDPCNIIYQQFIIKNNTYNDMGIIHLCNGGSFEFQGVRYDSPGNYQVIDDIDCAVIHQFAIQVLDINIEIQSVTRTLDCNHPFINLNAEINIPSGSTIDYKWLDDKNRLQGTNRTLQVNSPGVYTLQIEVNYNGGVCTATEHITINTDFSKPEIVASIPVVRCQFPNERPTIFVSSLNGYSSAIWTTPTGTILNSLNIRVDSANVVTGKPYVLHLVGINGCVLDTSFVLQSNFESARLELRGDDLTCKMPIVTIEAKPNTSIDSIRWNKISPDQKFYGSHLSKLTHEVNEPGVYRVDVMASSSKCWTSEEISIGENMIYPQFTFDDVLKWNCNTNSIDINPVTSPSPSVNYRWSTSSGNILTDRNTLNIVIGSPGVYRLTGIDTDNGCVKSEDLIVEEETNKPSNIIIETAHISCFNEQNGVLLINGTEGGFQPYTYYLNNQPLFYSNITDLPKGNYTLEVRDKYDCVTIEHFDIDEPEVFEIETDGQITVDFNEAETIGFTTNYPISEIESILWIDESGNVIGNDFTLDITTTLPKFISLEVTTINGCQSKAQIRVSVNNDMKVYFPNIFSPNGDGVNDRLIILKNKIPATFHKLAIYDRLGNMVYLDNKPDFESGDEGWDGTFRGQYVLPGVYVIVVEYSDFTGKLQVLKQDLTVIR